MEKQASLVLFLYGYTAGSKLLPFLYRVEHLSLKYNTVALELTGEIIEK
ncbi:MAG: hypothetical protein ACOX33_11295 [Dethiobacteria bacterium]|nr:hypothetical protein [Bacillota bacterium]